MKIKSILKKKVLSLVMATTMLTSLFSGSLSVLAEDSMDTKLECETVWNSSSTGYNDVRTTDPNVSGGKFTFMQPSSVGAIGHWIQFELTVPKTGKYEVYLGTKDNGDRGIYEATIGDGTVLGTADLYSAEAVYREHKLGEYVFTEDSVMLKLTCTGANENSSKKNGIAADYIRLVAVEEPLEEVKIEGESLTLLETDYVSGGSGVNEVRAISGASEGKAYFFQPMAKKYIKFSFPTPKAGTYEMYIGTKTDVTRGIYDINIDGTSVGEFDGYDTENIIAEKKVADVTFTDEVETSVINFNAIGMNANATAANYRYGIIIDYIRFEPKAEGGEVPPVEVDGEIVDTLGNFGQYSEDGDGWSDGALLNYDEAVKTKVSTTVGSTATFSCYPPELAAATDANYDVYTWIPANNVNGTNVKYTISTSIGLWSKTIDQTQNGGTWVKLATVTATGETAFEVKLLVGEAKETYATAIKLVKTTNKADEQQKPGTGTDTTSVAVLVNQSGYDTDKSKRATVVNTPDGTAFYVKNAETKEVAYTGVVNKGIANFTDLKPSEKTDYYIECNGAISFTFTIANNWIQKVSAVPALEFMDESRHDAWKYGEMTGSMGWRDSHQFSFELNSLVLQYMANPSLYENLPYDIYRANDTLFDSLKVQNEPDIIWLMKYGMERYYDFATNQSKQLHGLIKEQMAYVLYIYPHISEYMSEEEYIKYRDFTFKEWTNPNCNFQKYPITGEKHNLLEVQTAVGIIKGSYPPGHSIAPNLMMYEIAKRDNLPNPEQYFEAAYKNCEYLLENFDIASTKYSKGQRMSEHVCMENLTFFQEMYPDRAPANLKSEIERWADTMILRSNNLWDMRMAASTEAGDPKDYWTGAAYAKDQGQWSSIMNEPGNEAGVQAIMFAASRIVDDPAKAERLKEIGISAVDDMYGRNPYGRAFFYNYTDIEGLDLGWFSKHGNEPYDMTVEAGNAGYGKLGGVTARIDASPKEWAYPYNPNSDQGYVEAWVAYNTAWNSSIAYSAADDIEVYVDKKAGNSGEKVNLRVKAPANIDGDKQESIEVVVLDKTTGNSEKITLTEEGKDSSYFACEYVLPEVAFTTLEFSYGLEVFKETANVIVKGSNFVDTTSIKLDKEEASVVAGLNTKLSVAEVLPENASSDEVSWETSDSSVAIVMEDGTVKGLKEGVVTITAASVVNPDVKSSCKVTVTKAIPVSIIATIDKAEIIPNETAQVVVSGIKYSDDTIETELNQLTIKYSVEDREKISVDETGLVKGKRYGTSNIIITVDFLDEQFTTKVAITVKESLGDPIGFELEKFTRETSEGSIGLDGTFNEGSASGGVVVTFKPTAENEWINFKDITLEAATYKVKLRAKQYDTYGKYQMYIDGEAVGDVIDYKGTVGYFDFDLGEVQLTGDNHEIKFVCNGKTGSGYNLGVDKITFTKTEAPYPEFADLSELEKTINDAKEILANVNVEGSEIEYSEKDILEYKAVLAEAEDIYNQDEPVQEDINAVNEKLIAAKETFLATGTPVVKVNKDELQKVYDENKDKKEADYTPKTWAEFKLALDSAKAILDNVEATQEEVDNIKTTLELKAIALTKKANKGNLSIAIKYAEAVKAEESYNNVIPVAQKAFEAALLNANNVMANENATQNQVDNALMELIFATQDLGLIRGDKENLEELVKVAEALDLDQYTSKGKEEFIEALAAAKEVLDDENAIQSMVDEAEQNLRDAMSNLVLKADKTLLAQGISIAEGLDLDKYVDAGKEELAKALEEAKIVFANEDATQEEVNAANEKLLIAVMTLRVKANKTNLESAVNKANSLDLSKYTESSVAKLNAVLVTAQAILEDETLTIKEQSKVDSATKKVLEAIKKLELKKNNSNNGNHNGNHNGNNNGSHNGNNNGNHNGNNKPNNPKR